LCETGNRVPLSRWTILFPKREGVFAREGTSMALILLPDECFLPNTAKGKRKQGADREPDASRPLSVTKSDSQASLSSRSSAWSKTSDQSTGSSKCSFAPANNQAAMAPKRVRIAIGGSHRLL